MIQRALRGWKCRKQYKELKKLDRGRFIFVQQISSLENALYPSLKTLLEEYIPNVVKTFSPIPSSLRSLFDLIGDFAYLHLSFRDFLNSKITKWHPASQIAQNFFLPYAGLFEASERFTSLYWENYPLITSHKFIKKLSKTSKLKTSRIQSLTNLISSPIDNVKHVASIFPVKGPFLTKIFNNFYLQKILYNTLPTSDDYSDMKHIEPLFSTLAKKIQKLHSQNAANEKIKSIFGSLK